MRIINKKYLLIIILVGIIITGVIILKPHKEVQLDNVILKQEVNNKSFAMYKEDDENNYVLVNDNKFPDMYVLNIEKSQCIDNNGNKLENVLNYENNAVTITSGNTTYCYLYFDKSLGLEIKEEKPNKLSEDVKGAMYRFQGQANDEVQNYICFGTNNKEECVENPDHHMYRIIGIEAETGRVKVIKKEALNQTYQWWEDYNSDKTFPDSNIYKAISGNEFLKNQSYIPEGWGEKISDNTWTYGDMYSNSAVGAKQIGEGLFETETGKKETLWCSWADENTEGAIPTTVEYEYSEHKGETVYYTNGQGNWTKTFKGKVSLMYLHDYYYSVSDTANCQYDETKYEECKTGWMHLSNNDKDAPNSEEWTMSRYGWFPRDDFFTGHLVADKGYTTFWRLNDTYSVRPVFYIGASQALKAGTGTDSDPFLIN